MATFEDSKEIVTLASGDKESKYDMRIFSLMNLWRKLIVF